MMSLHSRLAVAALLSLSVAPAQAQTSYPMITRVEPAAARRGTTTEVSIAGGGTSNVGGDFAGAWKLLCEGPGLTGEVVGVDEVERPAAKAKAQGKNVRRVTSTVKARLHVAADAPLGPREVRVVTPLGVSTVGLVVVVNDPVVLESDDKADDEAKGAQVLTLPCVVAGAIAKTEDVDWFAFEAKAGQRLTFSVWANRLENKIHDLQVHFDPILSLHDATGRELATDDNHDFADPLLSFEFQHSGTHYLQVRDTTYSGNASWTYVLQATGGPVATSVFPLGVKPGARAELHAKGPNIDPSRAIALEVPGETPLGPWLVSLPTENGPTLATPLVVTPLPIVRESDDAPAEFEKAQAITLPAAICGKLGTVNDVDSYRFEAKKGSIYSFEVVARRAGATIDPVLKVQNDKDATLVEADDTPGFGKDPRLEWTAPADGVFALQLSDLHSRGGDEFGYVLTAEAAKPDFAIVTDPDKLSVGPGGRVPLFVQVTRRAGFEGAVMVVPEGLPPGVSASPLTIAPKSTQGVIVVSAAPDSKLAGELLTVRGKAATSAGEILRIATPKQEIYLPGGGRALYPVDTLPLAVTEPSDITVEASPKAISLKPGETATIDVTVTRKEGYDKGVNLAVVLQHLGQIHANPLPAGVTVRESGSKTLLGPTETKGKIILEAKADAAPVESVPICVMGHVSINFVVKTAYASEVIEVSVAPK